MVVLDGGGGLLLLKLKQPASSTRSSRHGRRMPIGSHQRNGFVTLARATVMSNRCVFTRLCADRRSSQLDGHVRGHGTPE